MILEELKPTTEGLLKIKHGLETRENYLSLSELLYILSLPPQEVPNGEVPLGDREQVERLLESTRFNHFLQQVWLQAGQVTVVRPSLDAGDLGFSFLEATQQTIRHPSEPNHVRRIVLSKLFPTEERRKIAPDISLAEHLTRKELLNAAMSSRTLDEKSFYDAMEFCLSIPPISME